MQPHSQAFLVKEIPIAILIPITIPPTTPEAAGCPGPAGMRAGARASRHSQVGNARFTDGGGDGFDGRAERVEELRELAGAFRPPAFLHHEAGHGDDIGVEGRAVRHGGGGIECGRGGGHHHLPRRGGAGQTGRGHPPPARLAARKGVPPLRPTDALK